MLRHTAMQAKLVNGRCLTGGDHMPIKEQYARAIHQMGYVATWLTTLKTNLRNVGIIRDGILFKQSITLEDYGIAATNPVDDQLGEALITLTHRQFVTNLKAAVRCRRPASVQPGW